jgi:sigma-B regulation protein RsbU (phosphoserine phosphatase)
MTADTTPHIRLNVRAKILIVFLVLSMVSLIITGFFAFTSLDKMGRYAQGSSQSLGESAVNDSSVALQQTAEEYLLRVASDQAEITNVLFEDTNSETNLLAAHAAMLQNNPPMTSVIPAYSLTDRPREPYAATLVVSALGTTVTPASEEGQRLSGMDDMLRELYKTDEDMTGVYVATESGMTHYYPWRADIPPDFDPRSRDWFTRAVATDALVWSDAPYVDAAGQGLIMTCSRAINSPKYGYWVIGSDVSVTIINEDFMSQTLGGNGYAVLIDQFGNIISRPGLSSGSTRWDEPFPGENAFISNDPALVGVVTNMTAGKSGISRVWFDSNETYIAYAPVRSMNWSLAVSMPVEQVTRPMKKTEKQILTATNASSQQIKEETSRLLTIFSGLVVILLVLVLFMSVIFARIITRPVELLKVGTEAIGRGDLDYHVTIETGDEFEELAHSFNTMAADLKKNIENLQLTTAEKERYTKELEIARTIQASFLPETMPDIRGFDIAAVAIPALEVGGDFYDFIPVSHGRWALVIADVSGKGVSAALFMALSRTLIRANLEGKDDTTGALRQANRMIYRDAQSSMFVTAFSLVVDPDRLTLSCVNAGHNPPLVIRHDSGDATFLREDGIALGVLPEMEIHEEDVLLMPGDLVVMYTDGVTEAFNEKYEEFGAEQLIRLAKDCRTLPAREVIDHILEAVRTFAGTTPQSDDITLVVLRVMPADQSPEKL